MLRLPHRSRLAASCLVLLAACDGATELTTAGNTDRRAVRGPSRLASPATAAELTPGVSIPLSGDAGSQQHFVLRAPEGAVGLTVNLAGYGYYGTNDADLYVRHGEPPTLQQWDCRPSGADDETCPLTPLVAGTYYVMVHGSTDYTNFTLYAVADWGVRTPGRPTAAAGAGYLEVSWTDSSVARTHFELQRQAWDEEGWGPAVALGTAPAGATTFRDSTATEGVAYTYHVRTCNGGRCSPYAASRLARFAVPPAPWDFSAGWDARGARFNWSHMESPTTVQFRVERRRRGPDAVWGEWAPVDVEVDADEPDPEMPTVYVLAWDRTAETGAMYDYRVRACGAPGRCSDAATHRPLVVGAPASPSGLRGSVSAPGRVNLAWSSGSILPVANFQVWRGTRAADGSFGGWVHTIIPDRRARAYTDSGTVPGNTYRYLLSACGSVCSVAQSVGVHVPLPPAAPSGVTAVAATGRRIDLTWTDESSNESSYQVWRRAYAADGTGGPLEEIATRGGGTTSHVDYAAVPGTTFRYQVRACNATGCSAFAGVGVRTPTVPAAPTGVTAVAASPTRITVAWTDASSNESGFRVSRRAYAADGTGGPLEEIATRAPGSTTYTDPSAAPGTRYRYYVRACNTAGCSASGGSGLVTASR